MVVIRVHLMNLHILLLTSHLQLDQFSSLTIDDRWVSIFQIILWQLSCVFDAMFSQIIYIEGLLKSGITHVFFIGQHFQDVAGTPLLTTNGHWDIFVGQQSGNLIDTQNLRPCAEQRRACLEG